MLPTKNRLFYKEAAFVRSRGKRVSGDLIELVYISKEKPPSRWAVFVPKSQVKKAVDRNRTRRLIHENLRLDISERALPHDGVLFVRRFVGFSNVEKTRAELNNVFTKAGLLK